MDFAPRFTITNAITAALTEIERARGILESATLTDEWIDAMRSEAFLLEAHHTTPHRGNAADFGGCGRAAGRTGDTGRGPERRP